MAQGLETYWEDMAEKILLGNPRLKRRSKTTEQAQSASCKVSVPGVWVRVDLYEADMGKKPEECGHHVKTIRCPTTGELMEAAFIPKRKHGYYDGSLVMGDKIKFTKRLDDNVNALRDGQVEESFQDEFSGWVKEGPGDQQKALTIGEMNKLASQPRPEPVESIPEDLLG